MEAKPIDPRLVAAREWQVLENKKIVRQRRIILSIVMVATTLAVLLLSRGKLKIGMLVLMGEMIMTSIMVWVFSHRNSHSTKKFYDTLDQMAAPAHKESNPLHIIEEG